MSKTTKKASDKDMAEATGGIGGVETMHQALAEGLRAIQQVNANHEIAEAAERVAQGVRSAADAVKAAEGGQATPKAK